MRHRQFQLDDLRVNGVPLQLAAATLKIERDTLVMWTIEATTVTMVSLGRAEIEARGQDGRTFNGQAIVTDIHGTLIYIIGTGELKGLEADTELS